MKIYTSYFAKLKSLPEGIIPISIFAARLLLSTKELSLKFSYLNIKKKLKIEVKEL